MVPTIRKDPDEIILHIGTNYLKSDDPQRISEGIINLADNIAQNSNSKVTISGLLHRTDDPMLSNKVPKVNKLLTTFTTNLSNTLISTKNPSIRVVYTCLNMDHRFWLRTLQATLTVRTDSIMLLVCLPCATFRRS